MGNLMKLRMLSLALTVAAVVCACPVRQGHAQGGTLVLAVAALASALQQPLLDRLDLQCEVF
jgi:hypothetical protein